MGYTAFADDNLLNVLKNLSHNGGYSFGLILGQSFSLKDYIVHFAPSASTVNGANNKSLPEGGDICSVKKLGDYEDKWIGNHSRNVIKMLPGGMTILGVFVTCASSSSDTDVFNKLKMLAIHSYNSVKNNSFLHQMNSSNRLLLQYTLNSKTYVCKSIDAGSLNASLQPVDIKFATEAFKWYSVDSSINLVNFSPHFIPKCNNNYSLKKMLKDMLLVLQSRINDCECSVDHKFVTITDDLKTFKEKEERKIKELEKLTGKQINFNSKSVEVQLYDRRLPEEFSFKVDHVEQCVEVAFKGDIRSRVFVIGSTTLEDTIKAVKEDLIRCCATKFEMHWETNDISIFNSKSDERINEDIHVLPRRILFSVPDCNIQFSDYLFLDESAEDVIPSIQENFGIQISESSILDVLEAKSVSSIPTKYDETSSKKLNSGAKESRPNTLFLISFVLISLIVLLISIFIQFK